MKNILITLTILLPFALQAQKSAVKQESVGLGLSSDDYFPVNYEASKSRFIQDVAVIKEKYKDVEVGHFKLSSKNESDNLTVDHIYIPAQGLAKNEKETKPHYKNLIVITSGTHGPEGYAGSALQKIFIDKTLPQLDLSNTGVVLIHALNAWGFKYNRRDTENNVNLNRNFDVTKDVFKSENQGYDKLKPMIEISKPVTTVYDFPAGSLLKEMILKKDVTQASLTEAIGKGQYSSPKGFNFGGQDFEPQTVFYTNYLKQKASPYKQIFHIDIHTGLGDRGILHIMTKPHMTDQALQKQQSLFTPEEKNIYQITPPAAEGFYDINGDHADIIRKLFLDEKDKLIVGVTAEFGTVGNGLLGKITTINRLIRENRGYFAGYANERVKEQVQQDYLELFNPSSLKWKNNVINKGEFLMNDIVKRFVQE